jgi:hypothetical protein
METKSVKIKPKIYIASAYTKGDTAVNVKAQLDCVDILMDLGCTPFAPLYSHFQHMTHPRPYTDWVEFDLEWVPVCDALLRLPGESPGADGEVRCAIEHDIPVFYSIEDLCNHFNIYFSITIDIPKTKYILNT